MCNIYIPKLNFLQLIAYCWKETFYWQSNRQPIWYLQFKERQKLTFTFCIPIKTYSFLKAFITHTSFNLFIKKSLNRLFNIKYIVWLKLKWFNGIILTTIKMTPRYMHYIMEYSVTKQHGFLFEVVLILLYNVTNNRFIFNGYEGKI